MVPPTTARVRFRRFRPEDAVAVEEMFADTQARTFFPHMAGRAAAEGWVRWSLENYSRVGVGLWVIEDAATAALLGDCGLTYQRVEGERLLELGYHLKEEHRGLGYATEAGRACLDFALRELLAPVVCSIVDPQNTPSIGVASRLHSFGRVFTNSYDEPMLLFWTEA